MKYLVTGGAGFIGSHLVDRLLGEGHRVTVLDNFDPFYDPAVKERNIEPHLTHSEYRLVRADLRDGEAMRQQLEGGYDAIVHLAACAGVRPSIENPARYQEVNVGGTQNLLELAREWGVEQFVFASSSSVYGISPNVPWKEDEPGLRPISPYASTKVSCELLGHVYSHLYGIRFIGLRFFTVYGPRQRPDLAIHKFSRMILAGEAIPFYGNGDTSRDYSYIDDIISGIHSAIHYRDSRYEILNLGNDRPVTLNELVECIEQALGRKAVLKRLPEQPGDVPHTRADVTKSAALLGYHAVTPLSVGIGHFVEWLKTEGMADK
jgi:UDP-glucuronate 4-epimerase